MIDEARAIELVQARLQDLAKPGWTYPIAGIREHPTTWAIGVQPHLPDGQPAYDIMGFDVDKVTGAISQTV